MVELSTSQALSTTTTINELEGTESSSGCNTDSLLTQYQSITSDVTQDHINHVSRSVVTVKATEAAIPRSARTPARVDNSQDSYESFAAIESTTYTATTSPLTLTSSISPGARSELSANLQQKDIFDYDKPELNQNKLAIDLLSPATKQQQQKEQTNTLQGHHDSLTHSHSPNPQSSSSTGGYQLRALKGDKSTVGNDNLWSKNIDVPLLSIDLIDETLNYFVNCRHRLNQITKTFDDSDAYILLLQEKEMDLELVARIGQDLLKQFNEVKDSNESLKDELTRFHELSERLKIELAKCQEENQQLRYELASKVSLLDTFMEEEEDQLENHDITVANNRSDANEEEFTSLRSQSDRVTSTNDNTLYKRLCELQDELLAKDEVVFKQNIIQQERNQRLEVQLRESESRLSGLEAENETLRENQKELYEEIKTYSRNFAELLRIFSESQRESRIQDICNISFDSFMEPPPNSSLDSQLNSTIFLENHYYDTQQCHQQASQYQEQHYHPQMAKPLIRNSCSMAMSSSLHEELQELSSNSDQLLIEREDDYLTRDDGHNEAEDEASDGQKMRQKVSPLSSPSRHHRSYYNRTRVQPTHITNSGQNLNKERCQKHNLDSDSGGVSDEADSGLHTTNISTSTTPINSGLNFDTDSDLDNATIGTSSSKLQIHGSRLKNWMGLSTFTLTTLILICLSAALNNTTNSNLAQKLQQIRFGR